VPLPLSIVLAARFALGALMVGSTADNLDPKSKRLGPQPYRMRGGGPNSNRGFAAGRLGDSRDGGTRRFEGSLELRVPLGDEFGFVLFGDVGDVSDMGAQTYADGVTPKKPAFRFAHLNTAVGFGLRYFSVLGAIRLDAGWRIPSLQTLDNDEPRIQAKVLPNAVHLTIGEAF
jgi:outer membrane protein assembly factor BamA